MSPKNMSEDTTSEDKASRTDAGRLDIAKEKRKHVSQLKKVRRLRRCNVRMLIMSVIILMTLCVMLIARVRTLDGMVAKLAAQVDSLMRLTAQQREMMDQMAEEKQSAMGDNAVVGNNVSSGSNASGGDMEKETGSDEDIESGEPEEEEPDAAHKVYLTFDDGPSANTEKILDILERYDVKATFFVVGTACENNEEALKKIVEAGHTLGMHSCTHKYSELYTSVESFGEDLREQQDYLYEVTGVKSRVYRFPGGSSNKVSDIEMKEFAQYLDSQEVRFFDWNISSGDGGSYLFPTETIIENCTSNISKYRNSVILMHDAVGKSTTLEALPTIIEKIKAMEDTVILPITGGTEPVQHIQWKDED